MCVCVGFSVDDLSRNMKIFIKNNHDQNKNKNEKKYSNGDSFSLWAVVIFWPMLLLMLRFVMIAE